MVGPIDEGALEAPETPGLDDAEVAALAEGSCVVREGALGPVLASMVLASLQRLDGAGGLRPAGVGLQGRKDPSLRSDRTTWLEHAGPDPAMVALWCWFDSLRLRITEATWVSLRRFSVQLAHFPGQGTRYVRHIDALPGDPNRLFTAIVYLNPAWEPGHGGMLRTWPPAGPMDLAPTWDRLLLFRSDCLPHEVLPTFAPRWAAAAWMRGTEALPLLPDPEAVLKVLIP